MTTSRKLLAIDSLTDYLGSMTSETNSSGARTFRAWHLPF